MNTIPRDDDSPSISGNALRHRRKIRGNARHRASDNEALAAKGTLQAPARRTKEDSQKHSDPKNTHLSSAASGEESVDKGTERCSIGLFQSAPLGEWRLL